MVVTIRYKSESEPEARLAAAVFDVVAQVLQDVQPVEDTPPESRYSFYIFKTSRKKRKACTEKGV